MNVIWHKNESRWKKATFPLLWREELNRRRKRLVRDKRKSQGSLVNCYWTVYVFSPLLSPSSLYFISFSVMNLTLLMIRKIYIYSVLSHSRISEVSFRTSLNRAPFVRGQLIVLSRFHRNSWSLFTILLPQTLPPVWICFCKWDHVKSCSWLRAALSWKVKGSCCPQPRSPDCGFERKEVCLVLGVGLSPVVQVEEFGLEYVPWVVE